jgi:hypothetical protein
MKEKEEEGLQFCETIPNLHLLLNSSFDIPGTDVTIVGSTLWTDLTMCNQIDIQYIFNDFKLIAVSKEYLDDGIGSGDKTPFTPSLWIKNFCSSYEYITQQLEKDGRQFIIVSHHLPTFDLIDDRYKNYKFNCGFASDLSHLLENEKIIAWMCGHSHGQKMIGKAHLNARGYPGEESCETYNPSYCLEF